MKLFLFLLNLLCISTTSAINVLHITDIHYDDNYAINSPNNCLQQELLELRCCRNNSIPISPNSPAREIGELLCDTTYYLLNQTLLYFSSYAIDLIFWTGDNTDHHFFSQSEYNILNEIKITTNLIEHYFPKIPVIPVLGNHDTYPLDQYNPYMIKPIYDMWKQWVPIEFLINNGTYKVNYYNRTYIVLNSLVYDTHNIFNQTNNTNILYDYLKNNNNEHTWILGHIPLCAGEAGYNFSEFMNTLNYTTSFWGHSHTDQIRLGNKLVMYIAPSLLPDSHYPEIRIYNITDKVEDYVTFILDNFESNINNTNNITYKKLYSAKELYSLSDLSYNSWYNFFQNLYTNITLRNSYYYNTNPPFNNNTCDESCLKGIISDMNCF